MELVLDQAVTGFLRSTASLPEVDNNTGSNTVTTEMNTDVSIPPAAYGHVQYNRFELSIFYRFSLLVIAIRYLSVN